MLVKHKYVKRISYWKRILTLNFGMFKFVVHVYTNATVYDCDICIRCAHESQKTDTSDEMRLRVFITRAMLSYGSVRYFITNILLPAVTHSSFLVEESSAVKRVHNSRSIEQHFRVEIETRSDSVLDSCFRESKNFAFLFCPEIIASIDNFFSWDKNARKFIEDTQSEKEKEKTRKCHQSRNESRFNRYKETTSCLEALYYYERKQIIVRRVQIYSRIY